MMKYKFVLIVTLTMFFGAIGVNAARVELVDYIEGVIKVSGVSSHNVELLILKPNVTLETGQSDSDTVSFVGSFEPTNDGSYSFLVKIGQEGGVGNYSIYVVENNGTPQKYEIFISDTNEKTTHAVSLVDTIKTSSTTEIVAMIQQSKDVLALNTPFLQGISLNETANFLKDYFSKNSIVFDETNPDSSQNISALTDLQHIIKSFALVSCYNQGKSEFLFDDGESFSHLELLDFTGMESVYKVSSYSLYQNQLSQAGKKEVQKGMLGKNRNDIKEMQQLFTDLVMFHGISKSEQDGYGHIQNFVTKDNVVFVENNADTKVLETYFSINDKSSVDMIVKRNQSYLTLANYKSQIENYAKDSLNPSNTPLPSGGGGGGGGGTSFSADTPAQISTPSITPTPTESTPQVFTDLQEVKWAEEAILFLHQEGVISGFEQGLFMPTGVLTREQAVKIICLAFDIPITNGMDHEFIDVDKEAWYAPYVNSGKIAGVLNGISQTQFGVGLSISRQDFATIIYRTVNPQEANETAHFSDHDQIPEYAKNAVSYLKYKGVINGYEDGTFGGNKEITRAEAAKIVFSLKRIKEAF